MPGGQFDLADEVRGIPAFRHFPRQHDSRAVEVETLADRRLQVLLAALGAQEASREACSKLVRVAQAIGADVAVGAEQLHEVEVGQRGVEHWQVVLVAKRYPRVAQPRLQRLHEMIARASQALEHESAVEREDRGLAVGRVVRFGRGIGERVRSDAPGRARLEVIARTAKRPGDARHRVGAQPRDAFIPIEPDGLGIE